MTTIAALLILLSYTVTDGDTLRADGVGIRLWGIDAPEPDEPGGPEATAAMRHLTDGRDLACVLVAGGWARDWPHYSGGAYAGCEQ